MTQGLLFVGQKYFTMVERHRISIVRVVNEKFQRNQNSFHSIYTVFFSLKLYN